jgi:hypothetical protein
MLTFVPAIRRLAVWADQALQKTSNAILHPYRRDRYYMRGPGPKWHAKHDPQPNALRRKGPLTWTLDVMARLYEALIEARAVRVQLEAERLSRRYQIASKHHDGLPIVR